MKTKGLFCACAIAAVAATMSAQPSRADSLNEAVTAGGMGAQLDGFRAFVLPGVMPAALVNVENHRKNADTDVLVSVDHGVEAMDDWSGPATPRSQSNN